MPRHPDRAGRSPVYYAIGTDADADAATTLSPHETRGPIQGLAVGNENLSKSSIVSNDVGLS